MSTLSCVEIAKTVIDRMGRGDFAGALEFISGDFICEEAASLPYGGVYRGKQGFSKLMTAIASTWEDLDIKLHHIFGEGDDAVLIQTITGKSNGKAFSMPLLEHLRTRDGLIVLAVPCYMDAAALGQLYANNKQA